ncbi:MAG: TetR/AcrR family transcriptional regulator [Dehalococcoidia bacterium]
MATQVTSTNGKAKTAGATRPTGGPQMRRHILDVALQLFSTNGYSRTSTRDIARAAGMSDAGIYYHFRSKREVIEALYEASELVQGVERLEALHAEGDPEEVLTGIALATIEVLNRNREILKLVINESLTNDEAAINQHRDLMHRWVRAMAHVFSEFMDAGKIRRIDPQVTGQSFVHAIWGAFVDTTLGSYGEEATSVEEIKELMSGYVSRAVEYMLSGIRSTAPVRP